MNEINLEVAADRLEEAYTRLRQAHERLDIAIQEQHDAQKEVYAVRHEFGQARCALAVAVTGAEDGLWPMFSDPMHEDRRDDDRSFFTNIRKAWAVLRS